MFPTFDFDKAVQEVKEKHEREQNPGIGFKFDFKKGEFVIKDGRIVEIRDIEAVKAWIEKILLTEKFEFKIYEEENRQQEYGVTIKKLIVGKKIPLGFLKSELKREITEALLKNPAIAGIKNFQTTQEKTTLKVAFKVVLKDGRTFNQEVSF